MTAELVTEVVVNHRGRGVRRRRDPADADVAEAVLQ
jgi:hypothetical protein